MFMKLVVCLALVAVCSATSCGLKNVLIDLTGNIAVVSSDGQQVTIETNKLGSLAGIETIKLHITGPNGITKTLQYKDEQVSFDGQRESDILTQVFAEFSGPQNEISLRGLTLTVINLVKSGKINLVVLKALQQLSCEDRIADSSLSNMRQQQQLQRLFKQNTGDWWSLGNQFGQPKVVKNQISQLKIQQALQEEAQLAEIAQIKAYQEAKAQAQLVGAVLEKEDKVHNIAQNEAWRKAERVGNIYGSAQQREIQSLLGASNVLDVDNVGLVRAAGVQEPLSPRNVALRNILSNSQGSIIGADKRQRVQQQMASLRPINQVQQQILNNPDVAEEVQQVALELVAQGIPYPQNIKTAQQLVAQRNQQTWLGLNQSPGQTVSNNNLWQLTRRTRLTQPFFI